MSKNEEDRNDEFTSYHNSTHSRGRISTWYMGRYDRG
ncbi:hypothetical protein VPHK479_0005 [Vibrio phage K479]